MGFSRQEYWSGFPFPGDPPDPGIESWSPVLQADYLPTKLQGKSLCILYTVVYKSQSSLFISPSITLFLSDESLADISSPSVACLLNHLILSFAEQIFVLFCFNKVQLLNYFLYCALDVLSKNSLPNPYFILGFLLCYHLRVLLFCTFYL